MARLGKRLVQPRRGPVVWASHRSVSAAVLLLLGCAAIAGNTRAALAQPQVQPQQAELVRRDIAIDVQVLGPEGEALVDAPIFAYTKYSGASGVTGPDGRTLIEINPAVVSDNRVLVQLYDGNQEEGISDERRLALYSRYLQLRDHFAFRHEYPLVIDNTANTYSMTIQVLESSVLSGTFVALGEIAEFLIVGGVIKPVGVLFTADESGRFSVRIERGMPAQLKYISPNGQSRILEITAEQTADDFDLGNIPVNSLVNDSTLAVEYIHPGRVLLDPEQLAVVNGQVTMVEAAGAYTMTFFADPELSFLVDARWNVNQSPPQVPAGTYYLVAGSHWQTEVEALRLALLDGRQAALDAAGVVSVTVSPTQPGNVQFDALANTTAILSVAGDLVD